MSIATRFVSSTARPRLDLSGCVLYAPLWRPDLGGSTFTTIGDGGIPTHLCTVTGATHGTQGRTFVAASSQFITIPDADSLDVTKLTVIIWVNTAAVGYQTYVQKWDTNTNPEFYHGMWLLGTSDPGLYIGVKTGGGWQETVLGTVPTGKFTQLAMTYDTLGGIGYIDAVNIGTLSQTGNISASTFQLTIGARQDPSNFANGTIGEVHIFNRAFTALEIQQNYLATRWRYV